MRGDCEILLKKIVKVTFPNIRIYSAIKNLCVLLSMLHCQQKNTKIGLSTHTRKVYFYHVNGKPRGSLGDGTLFGSKNNIVHMLDVIESVHHTQLDTISVTIFTLLIQHSMYSSTQLLLVVRTFISGINRTNIPEFGTIAYTKSTT